MDALVGAELDQLGRWMIGVQFDLVDSWHNLEIGRVKELLKVFLIEVGYADILDLARVHQLLQFSPWGCQQIGPVPAPDVLPSISEIPIGVCLVKIFWSR